MRSLLLLIVLFSLVKTGLAQEARLKKERIDSLTLQLKSDSAYLFRPQIAKPYLRVENRYSFISKKPVNLFGFLAGIVYRERHIFCAGYYTLNLFNKKYINYVDANNVAQRHYLILNYFITCYQYVILNNKFVQVNIPLEVGYGLYSNQASDKLEAHFSKSNGSIVPISGGFQAKFKILKWGGISIVGGYRYVVQERDINLNFRGLYYSFGVWIDARQALRMTKYHFKKKQYRENVRAIL